MSNIIRKEAGMEMLVEKVDKVPPTISYERAMELKDVMMF
jgi:hypothetical protein